MTLNPVLLIRRGCFAIDFDGFRHCIKINAKTGAYTSLLIQAIKPKERWIFGLFTFYERFFA